MELAVFKNEYYDEKNNCMELYFTWPRRAKTLRVVTSSKESWYDMSELQQQFLTKTASIGCIHADNYLTITQKEVMLKEIDDDT